MKRQTIGALLILLFGAAAVAAWSYFSPRFEDWRRTKGSDAKESLSLRIGGDGYVGYWFITSPDMRKQTARRGLAINFTDDGGAYGERLAKLAAGEYDAIVLPINSYLQHGAAHGFPGVIVAAIADSKGADGIVGFADKFPARKVSELNDAALRIVYTADSPSSFLLDLAIADFDLFHLRSTDAWRVEVAGSHEAYERAKRRDGDAFVLWEPDLSRALSEMSDLAYLWGSDKFAGYIKDVFVVHRDFLARHPREVTELFETYFVVVRGYANDRPRLVAGISQSTGLKPEVTEEMLRKIDWYTLQENATFQFGLASNVGVPAVDGVVNTILACTDVLLKTGRLQKDPLEGNPYRITNSSLLEALLKRSPGEVGVRGSAVDFSSLPQETWSELREVGVLRVEPISFQSGRSALDDGGKEQVDRIAAILVNNYPDYRVAVRGHTGPGDEKGNEILSRERAAVVAQRLVAVHGVDPDRLQAEGKGSTQPPPRKPEESERAYRYRLPRVEFVLLEDNTL